jgi:hypothetical protein
MMRMHSARRFSFWLTSLILSKLSRGNKMESTPRGKRSTMPSTTSSHTPLTSAASWKAKLQARSHTCCRTLHD